MIFPIMPHGICWFASNFFPSVVNRFNVVWIWLWVKVNMAKELTKIASEGLDLQPDPNAPKASTATK